MLSNHEEFLKQMSMLGELFDKQMTDGLLELYWESLQVLDDAQFKHAVLLISRSNKYPGLPKPAEFIELIHGTSKDQQDKADIAANQALLKLQDGMTKVSRDDSVQFDDRRIHKAVEHMGGWLKIHELTLDEWKFAKHDFIKIYKALVNQPIEDMPERLIGVFELDNINRGTMTALADHLKPKTHYIGNSKAVQIESRQNKMIGGK